MKRVLTPLILLAASAAGAHDGADDRAHDRPAFEPEIGRQLTLDRVFADASGKRATLGRTLDGRPALLLFGYHECPNLCGVAQRAVAEALPRTGLAPTDYRALFVSIDPEETPAEARRAQDKLARTTGADALAPWVFLTAADAAGADLAAETGAGLEARERIDQFVHPVAIIVLTGGGEIARVLPALDFRPRDLRLALVEASAGRLGSVADRVFLLCAGFDSSRGQYTPVVWAAVQAGGAVTVLVLGAGLLLLSRRRRA